MRFRPRLSYLPRNIQLSLNHLLIRLSFLHWIVIAPLPKNQIFPTFSHPHLGWVSNIILLMIFIISFYSFLLIFLSCIGLQPISNVVIVSGAQQTDSILLTLQHLLFTSSFFIFLICVFSFFTMILLPRNIVY